MRIQIERPLPAKLVALAFIASGAILLGGCLQSPSTPSDKNEVAQAAATAATMGNINLYQSSFPTPGQDFWVAGQPIQMYATVSNPEQVRKVEFFKNGALIASYPNNGSSIYLNSYTENLPGGYNFSARLTEISGQTLTTPVMAVWNWFQYKRTFTFDNWVTGWRIPDDPNSGVIQQMTVNAQPGGKVRDLRVKVYVKHTYDSDLEMRFASLDMGKSCMLASRNGGSGDDFGYRDASVFDPTVFRDDATRAITNTQYAPP